MTEDGEDELQPILFTRLLGAVIGCVLTELALFVLGRLYAGEEGGFWVAFGGRSEDPFALGASLGGGLALGLGLGAADEARARRGPRAALAVGVLALPLLAASTLYGALFAESGVRDRGLQSTLVLLGRVETWLFVGFAGLFVLSIHGAFLTARARGHGTSEQSFAMALAATVALVALAPLTLFFWTGGRPEKQGLLLVLVLARAPLLPPAMRLGDAVATGLRRRLLGLGSPPRAPVVRSTIVRPPLDEVARRLARGVESAGEVFGVAWRFLTLVAVLSVAHRAIGFESTLRQLGLWFSFSPHIAAFSVWLAYGSALFLLFVILALLAPWLSVTSGRVAARRTLLAGVIVLTTTALALPPQEPSRYWSTDPWGSLFLAGLLGILCARLVPGAVALALGGAYVAIGGVARHLRNTKGADTWPFGLPLTPDDWRESLVATAVAGLCVVLAGAALSGGRRRLVSALFTSVGALGAGATVLLFVADRPLIGYWFEGTLLPVMPAALLGGVAGSTNARGGRVARTSLVVLALLLPLGAFRFVERSDVPSDLSTKLTLFRAARGDPAAMLDVARRYDVGLGVAASSQEASVWYRRAAAAGLPEAMHRHGCRLAAGRGERRDPVAARDWLTRAATAGHVPAALRLATLEDAGSPQPRPPW